MPSQAKLAHTLQLKAHAKYRRPAGIYDWVKPSADIAAWVSCAKDGTLTPPRRGEVIACRLGTVHCDLRKL